MWSIFIEWFIDKYANRLSPKQQEILRAKYPDRENVPSSNKDLASSSFKGKRGYGETTISNEIKSICDLLIEEDNRSEVRRNQPGKNENALQSFLLTAFASDEFKKYCENLSEKPQKIDLSNTDFEGDPEEKALMALLRRQYFTDAKWYQWDLKTQWGMLLDLAVDASDRFGLVPSSETEHSNSGYRRAVPASSNTPKRYLKQVRMGEQFCFNIQVKTEGYLFIIEKDSLDEVFFLVDPILIEQTLSEIFIPENQKKEEYFTSSTTGKCELWAIVIPQEEKCKFTYLEDNCYYSCKNAEEQQPLKLQHLQMLLEYASENNEIEMIRTYSGLRVYEVQ